MSSSNSVSCYLRHMECGVMLTGNKQFRKWISWLVQYLLNSIGILRAFCNTAVANRNTGPPVSLMQVQSTSVLVRETHANVFWQLRQRAERGKTHTCPHSDNAKNPTRHSLCISQPNESPHPFQFCKKKDPQL